MTTLLCHAATFARIADRLKTVDAALDPIVVDDGGGVSRPWSGGDVSPGTGLDVVFANTDAFFSPQVAVFLRAVMGAERLGWVQSSAAGLEHPVLQAIGAKAAVYCSGHEQSPAIAEWVIWAAMDYFQTGPARRALQAGRRWERLGFREIAGSRWLVVGYGTIGEETGKRLAALGAHVTGVRRRPGPADGAAEIVAPGEMAAHLGEADGVVLCAPLTDETRHMIDGVALAAMKPDALLVNVGRGGLVDERALLAALDAGEIGHAALDVVETEPLPEDHPIWTHPKITLTPHIAAATTASAIRTDGLFLDNLERYLAGREMRNVIGREAFETGGSQA